LNRSHGRFAWYELLTTDMAAAQAFYGSVVGWSACDASTAAFRYRILSAGAVEVGGLMDLPPEARRMGAAPRWVGYVAVDDVDATASQLKQLGGSIYVPPTDSNIGRVSIVLDPQAAALGLVGGLTRDGPAGRLDGPGLIGWHELLATDAAQAFAFYRALFDWQAGVAEQGSRLESYQPFAVDGRSIGGMFNKLPRAPVPFWLYYFNVPDMDAALSAVKAGGGTIVQGPFELTSGYWIARCVDPQGAMFALQGQRRGGAESAEVNELAFASEWGGFASRGKLIAGAKGKTKK
jgi:predicted enzyme related to lactoylglutathione lyase